jgi:hypothetical protein
MVFPFGATILQMMGNSRSAFSAAPLGTPVMSTTVG